MDTRKLCFTGCSSGEKLWEGSEKRVAEVVTGGEVDFNGRWAGGVRTGRCQEKSTSPLKKVAFTVNAPNPMHRVRADSSTT